MKWLGLGLVVAGLSKASLSEVGASSLAAHALRYRDPATAPAAVTDLTARPVSDSAVVLQWTEVRSSSTAIPRYVVRYGTLGGGFQWATSADVLSGGCAAPIVGSSATGGRPHACVLSGLVANTAYRIQLVAYTGTLNSTAVFGPLSNIADVTTMERIGPMLVSRPRVWIDSIRGVQRVSVDGWGTWPVLVHPRFGDYQGTLEDSAGTVLAHGYLLLVRP